MISRIVLAAIALAMAGVLLLSDRPYNFVSAPRIAEVAVLPDDPRLAQVRRYTEIGSGFLPHVGGPRVRASMDRPDLKLGWSYREWSLMGMPFFASSEHGWMTYYETPEGMQVALIGPEQLALLEELTGRSYVSYSFPWYRYLWGWLLLASLGGWSLLKRREDRIAEDALWAA